MKVLVTGIAGFIGSHLADRLIKEGHQVFGIDNLSATGDKANLHGSVAGFSPWDVNDVEPDDVVDLMHGQIPDVIFHQAALGSVPRSFEHPLATHHANVTGTLQMLMVARELGVKTFVFASSSSIHGLLSPYAASKAAAEMYATAFSYSMNVIGLRYYNVFGARQRTDAYSGVVARWIAAMLRNEEVVVYGDPQISRDFTHVDNVVEANMLALKRLEQTPSEQRCAYFIDIGCEMPITLEQLHAALRSLIPSQSPTRIGEARKGDTDFSCARLDWAKSQIGYQVVTPFMDGLKKTVEWYKEFLIEKEKH